MKKAREFWVIEDGVNGDIRGAVRKKPSGISGGGSNMDTHVIEKSAFNELMVEAKKLREALHNYIDEHDHDYCSSDCGEAADSFDKYLETKGE